MGMKTFKYRLYPSKTQAKNLMLILDVARNFYNMCLEERTWAYKLEGRSISKQDQLREVKHYKTTFPQARQVHSHMLQVVAADVDKAFQAFFRRVKAGEKPGYPRFKGHDRFHSFGLKEYGNGFKLDGRRLKIFGAGRIPVRWHRPIEGDIKTLRVLHKAGRWYACFTCGVPDKPELPKTGQAIGIDVGISALITTSDGEKVEHPRFYRESQRKLRLLQRSLARKQNGSQNRQKALLRVQRWHEHTKNQRADFAHKLTFSLVQHYDWVACENLKINNLVQNHHLSKSILDAGWGLFKQLLMSKAVEAGRVAVFVDPAYTSRMCSNCGSIFEHFTLAERWVVCDCGLSLDRDHNAAINILRRSLDMQYTSEVKNPESRRDAPVLLNVADGGERAVETARL